MNDVRKSCKNKNQYHLNILKSAILNQEFINTNIDLATYGLFLTCCYNQKFCLGAHDGRRRVRRRRGEGRDTEFTVERHVLRTVGVMVWGAVAYGSRSPLVYSSQYNSWAL